MKTGLLLINLGTPDAPTSGAVRRYLAEFLWDPRVLDIHPIARALLLYLFILPLRPRRSAAAYRKVWTDRGSPLLCNSLDLAVAVREKLCVQDSGEWAVELGMRYGSPSIESAIDRLLAAGAERILALPLYPQYAASSTGSSLEEVFRVLGKKWVVPPLAILPPFYDDAAFLDAFAKHGREVIERDRADHVVISFHGLPERQVVRCDESGRHCLASSHCCDQMNDLNRNCYRAQCFATARGIASRLGLFGEGYSVSFQSRLGRTPWIKPYTDEILPSLAAGGKKRMVVLCPAFVADCLETLEEVGLRARDQFIQCGGQSLSLVPSLNAAPDWVEAVVAMARRQEQPRLPIASSLGH